MAQNSTDNRDDAQSVDRMVSPEEAVRVAMARQWSRRWWDGRST